MAMGQNYTPRAGETVLKIEVEGRGNVFIRLYTKEAPKTTSHILELVRNGFYNGNKFKRVEKSPKPYLVQVGEHDKSNGKIPYEDSGFKNLEGAVGLAHPVEDRDAGDGQFYMLLARASFLDNNYTVFGQVVQGMDVLQKIEKGDRIVSITVM